MKQTLGSILLFSACLVASAQTFTITAPVQTIGGVTVRAVDGPFATDLNAPCLGVPSAWDVGDIGSITVTGLVPGSVVTVGVWQDFGIYGAPTCNGATVTGFEYLAYWKSWGWYSYSFVVTGTSATITAPTMVCQYVSVQAPIHQVPIGQSIEAGRFDE